MPTINVGLCQCGCGAPTTLITKNYPKRGMVKGEYRRFVHGHNRPTAGGHTTATKAILRERSTGRVVSAETRAKQSAARLGKPNPASRRSPSPETRAKISATLTGRKASPEALASMRAAGAGRSLPDAARTALRRPEVQQRRLTALRAAFAKKPKKVRPTLPKYGSQEWKDKIGAAQKGRKLSPGQIEQMRQRRPTDETKQKNAGSRRAWWQTLTPDNRADMLARRSVSQKARWAKLTPEERRAKLAPAVRKAAIASKAMWASLTPGQRAEKLLPVWKASQSANPSSIEETVARLLDSLGVTYEQQVHIGRCLVDFYIRSKRLVIECDGTYWHNLPGRPESDARRDAWLKSRGFAVLRLLEPDIRSGHVLTRLREIA